jgi:hypothetical protein
MLLCLMPGGALLLLLLLLNKLLQLNTLSCSKLNPQLNNHNACVELCFPQHHRSPGTISNSTAGDPCCTQQVAPAPL